MRPPLFLLPNNFMTTLCVTSPAQVEAFSGFCDFSLELHNVVRS